MPPAGDELLVARVVPDVTGLDKQFDYVVPASIAASVAPGSRVRFSLHGRRVGGWVVRVGPPDGSVATDRLLPLAEWSGFGPSPEVIDLARWAALRWGVDRLRPFLVTASPPRRVRAVPPDQRTTSAPERPRSDGAVGTIVRRVPPNTDPLPVVLEAMIAGPTLVVHPAHAAARAIATRLRKAGRSVALVPDQWDRAAGGVDVVVGTRVAVWAPCPDLAAIVVLDEHDEALQEERTPTWHARDVAVERARRAGATCVLVGPSPTVTALSYGPLVRPTIAEERAGWPLLEIVDRGDEDPWKRSLVTGALIRHLRDPQQRVICVHNVAGRSRLLACRACRALQRCERCEAAVAQDDTGALVCARCATTRPPACQRCGSSALANVRPGVSRLREELEAAAGRPVVAVTGATDDVAAADVYVGTEAVLHRVRNTDVVAFLDLDAELLAPRYRAGEQAMALLVRAARLVGPRLAGGRLLVQTYLPHHEVLEAVLHADPSRLATVEAARRELLGLPPFRALAAVSGAGAEEFAAATGLEAAPTARGVLLRADDWDALGSRLAATPRPKGSRLRVAVDPPR